MEESRDTVSAWVRDRKLSMSVLLDPTGEASSAWHVSHTPMVYVVGKDGLLAAGGIGNRGWTAPAGRALLEALLAP
jgi:hypothetical protein